MSGADAFPYPDDDPSDVEDLADRFDRAATTIGDELASLRTHTSALPAMWTGASAQRATTELNGIAALAGDADAAMADAAAALDTYAGALVDVRAVIESLRTAYDEADADLAAARRCEPDDDPLDILTREELAEDEHRATIGRLTTQYDAAMADASDAARACGRALDEIAERISTDPDSRDPMLVQIGVLQYLPFGIAPSMHDGTATGTRLYYLGKALDEAGIDVTEWDPSKGLDHNQHIVEQVYEYYADLYRRDPDTYWWAGMAALIGPSFYGGFQDLETFADALEMLRRIADAAGIAPGTFPIGQDVLADLTALTAEELQEELRFYQEQLLGMQQEIFFDMAMAHEAYDDGGMAAIELIFEDDHYGIGPETIAAWRQIDLGRRTGNPDLIASGNAALLLREQQAVISNDYDRMRERPVTGEVVTYMMTMIGAPSVPGARGYGDVFPIDFTVSAEVGTPESIFGVEVPHVSVGNSTTITTPFPDGNIANFEDRWALIERDTLPVYADLAANHPDVILDELDRGVGERADDYVIQNRLDDILADIADWDVESGWSVHVGVP